MPTRETLLLREGLYTAQANIANVMSKVYHVLVPKGQVWELDPTRPFYARFMISDLQLTPSAAAAGYVTPTYPVQIPYVAGGGAAAAGLYEVLVGTISSVRTKLTVSARTSTRIDFAETVDAPGGVVTKVDAFYIPDVALPFQIRVEDPRFMTEMDAVIAKEDLRLFGEVDLWSRKEGLYLSSPLLIPQDFMLSFYVKTGMTIAWQDTAATPGNLPARLHLPYRAHSRGAFPGTLDRQTQLAMVGSR